MENFITLMGVDDKGGTFQINLNPRYIHFFRSLTGRDDTGRKERAKSVLVDHEGEALLVTENCQEIKQKIYEPDAERIVDDLFKEVGNDD